MGISWTEKEAQRLEAAVKAAESKTSAEFVAIVLGSSDNAYRRSLFSFLFLITLGLLIVIERISTSLNLFTESWSVADQVEFKWLSYILLGILALSLFFSSWGPTSGWFARRILSKQMEERVHQKACELFLRRNIHKTKDHTGVLILVSLFERRVEVLADFGIHDVLRKTRSDSEDPNQYWKDVVNELLKSIQEGKLVEGLETAILGLGEIMSKTHPRARDDQNELPDYVEVRGVDKAVNKTS